MIRYILILALLVATKLTAQQIVRFSGEVLSAIQSADGRYMAFSTPDSIYLVNTSDLRVGKKLRHHLVNPVLRQFFPENPNMLVLNEQRKPVQDMFGTGLRPYLKREEFREFPEDSLVIFSLDNPGASRKFSGSVYVGTGAANNQLLVAENNIFPYPFQGDTAWGASGTSLEMISPSLSKKMSFPQACRGFRVSIDFKKVLIAWYDFRAENLLNYSFSLLDLETEKIIYEQKQLRQLPADYCFSADGSRVAIAWQADEKLNAPCLIRIIDTKTGNTLHELTAPHSGISSPLTDLAFTPDNKQLVFATGNNEWHSWSFSEKRFTQKVHTGLTELFNIRHAFFINDRLFVAGRKQESNGLPGREYQLEKLSLQDLAVFSGIEQGTVESYADSSGYTMMLNDAYASNETPVVTFNPGREIFTLVRGNVLQVWDARQRKKLMQYAFRAKIKAVPDRSGKSILIIEARGQSSYNGYIRHIISLGNSSIRTSEVLGETGSNPDAVSSGYRAIPHPDKDHYWLSTDGSGKLWETSGPAFSDRVVKEWNGAHILQLEALPDQSLFAIAEINGQTGLWQWTDQPKQIAACRKSDQFIAGSQNIWLWSDGDTLIKRYHNGNALSPTRVPGKISHVEQQPRQNNLSIVYAAETISGTCFATFNGNTFVQTDTLDHLYANLYPLTSGEWLFQSDDEGLTTVFHNNSYRIPWGPVTPKAFLAGFDVSRDGKQIAFSNLLLDLATLGNQAVPKHTSYSILPDGSGRVEVDARIYQAYGSNSKKGYGLMQISDRTQDTVYSKTFIPATDDASAFEFFHNKVAVSPEGKWAVSYTEGLSFYDEKKMSPALVWNLQQMTARPLNIKKVSGIRFIPGTQQAALYAIDPRGAGMSALNYVADLNSCKLIDSTFWQDYIRYPESGLVINFRNVEWQIKKGKDKQTYRSFYSREYLTAVAWYDPAARIVAGSQNGQLLIWDTAASSPRRVFTTQGGAIEKIIFRGNRLYSLSANGDVTVVDMQKEEILITIKFLEKEKEWRYAMLTPAGHYRIDPDLVNDFHFVKNGTVYPLSSFELQGNRPDKVFAALGYADTAFLRSLELAWQSRVLRLRLDPARLTVSDHRPVVEWDRSNISLTTTERILPLKLELQDTRQPLKSILIRINGVPEYAAGGIPVNGNRKNITLDYPLSLNTGRNLISITAINAAGEESLEQTGTVYYQPGKPDSSNLFYIGIGVSEYADQQKNLRYAAKDVRDIARRLQQTKQASVLDTLLNENATLANIIQLKQRLQQTKTDDIVIISLSGHGMISRDSGFVFAPHDMDFNRPETKGLSIRMIESLLDGIPARRRLLLLDACHSGEDIAAHSGQLPPGVNVIKRGVIVEETDSSAAGRGRNQQLLIQELFGDLSRGNGSFVISAAAGNEYAYEGQSWNNGVFTYSFLNSLPYGDRRIPVRKLRAAIYDMVNKQTNGLQTPASRRENGWWNWEL